MASFNKVILMGNLTRDPELRYTQNNMAICKVGLAVNRRFKDGQSGEWKEEATFIDVTVFGKRGEAFEKYHKKGQSAFLEGELRLDTWDDKNTGAKRSKLYVVAENWEFVGGREDRAAGGGGGFQRQTSSAPAADSGGYGDYGAGGGDGDGESQAGGSHGGGGDFLDVDDTPF
ncbi:MAG: single-stranded DNA-binding protein [Planctomycetota bacterium]|nr:single-stranded DNA-binding protein [Planctomycetota bacterium]